MGHVRTRCVRWIVVGLLAAGCAAMAASAPAEEAASKPAVKTLADWWFKLVDQKSDKRIGARHVVIQQQTKGDLIVREQVAMAQGDKSVGYTATVRYTLEPALWPVSGELQSNIDGHPYLKGSVKFAGRRITSTSTLTDQDGKVIEPERTEQTDLPEEGLVLFSQGLEMIAPALLPAEGEREGILFAEFPDELNSLIKVQSGYRLTRADLKDGTASFQLFTGTSTQPVWQCVLEKSGAIREGTFYETRFVPATKEEAMRPVTG